MYKKKEGVLGFKGHLYETKLASLIYFRAKYNEQIENFSLASDVDELGAFDDIHINLKYKDTENPVVINIQAKHKEKENIKFSLKNKKYITKLFQSFLKLRRSYDPNKKSELFKGEYKKIDCFFVLYTNEISNPNNIVYKGKCADKLNDLINTGDPGQLLSYSIDDITHLYDVAFKEQLYNLVNVIATFLNPLDTLADRELSMNNDLIQNFHVLLAEKVFDLSDIQGKMRTVRFSEKFFDNNNDACIIYIKDILYQMLLGSQPRADAKLIIEYLNKPTDVNALSKVVWSTLRYTKGELVLMPDINLHDDYKEKLNNLDVQPQFVNKASEIAAKQLLTKETCSFKVFATFGNKDLIVRNDRRLDHLSKKFIELIENSKADKLVSIDDTDKGLLHVNGGFGGTVGNMLILDKETKMLKFTDKTDNLGANSKKLYENIASAVDNLHEYRIKVKSSSFPKLSFDYNEYESDAIKEFFDSLLLFTNQANENGVEKILKNEIETQQQNSVNNVQIKSDIIFRKYHGYIQSWWMNPGHSTCLTKNSPVYENSLNDVIEDTFNNFNELCFGSGESVDQSDDSMVANTSKDVKKIPRLSQSSLIPSKLKHKLKEIAAALIAPNRSNNIRPPDAEVRPKVIGIYPYKANEKEELSIEIDAEYEVLDDSQTFWWNVRDAHGAAGYIPRICVMFKDLVELKEYEWFVGDMTEKRAEELLSKANLHGCFLVRTNIVKSTLQIVVSVYNKDKEQTMHYDIQQNSRSEFYLLKKRSFLTIPLLIRYYKYNDDISPRFRTTPSDAKWDIDPSQMFFGETMEQGDVSRKVVRGKWFDCIDTTVKNRPDRSTSEEDLINEANIMTKLQHKHLLQFFGVLKMDGKTLIVTEHMRYGTLYNYIIQNGEFDRATTIDMIIQICKALVYLEKKRCIHRDVAASSTFLGEGHIVKLGNFYKARYAIDDKYHTSVGTVRIRWSSPEIIEHEMWSSKSDVWAFGVLMWEIHSNCTLPYKGKTNAQVREILLDPNQVLEKPSKCPDDIYQVMCACWKQLDSLRPKFETLEKRLKAIALTYKNPS